MSKVSSRNPSVCKPTGDAVSGGAVKELVLKLSTADAKQSKSSSLSSSQSSSSSPGIGVVVFKTISNKRNTTKTQQSMVYPSTAGSSFSSSKVTTRNSAKIISNSDKASATTTTTTTTPVKAPVSKLELTVITPTSRSSINAATPESKASSTINSSRGSKSSSSTVPRRSTFQKSNLISSKATAVDTSPNLVQVVSSDRQVVIADNSSNSNNNRASFTTSSTCTNAPIIVKAPSKHTTATIEISADDSSSTTVVLGTTNISDQSQTTVTGDYESKCYDNGTKNISTNGVNNNNNYDDDDDVDHDRGGDDDNDDDDEINDDNQGDLQSLKHELFLLKGDQAIDRESFDQLRKKLIDETAKVTKLTEQYHESQSKVIELMNDLKNARLEAQSTLSYKNNELMSIPVFDKDREISDLKQQNKRDSQYHQQQQSVITADISNNNNNNIYQVNNSVEELPRYQIALVNMDKELTKLKQEVLSFQKQSIIEKRSADLLTKQLLEQAFKNQELQAKIQVLSSELNVSKGKESKSTLVKVKDNLIARYHSLIDLHDPKTVDDNDYVVTLMNAKEGILVEQKSFEISNRGDSVEIERCMKRLQSMNSVLMGDLKRALQEKKSLCALLQEKDCLLGNFESMLRQKVRKDMEFGQAMQIDHLDVGTKK